MLISKRPHKNYSTFFALNIFNKYKGNLILYLYWQLAYFGQGFLFTWWLNFSNINKKRLPFFLNICVFIVEVNVVSHPLMLHSPRCCRTTSLQRCSSGMQKWAISRRRRLWRFLANNRDTRCAEESGEVLRDRSKNTACRQILSAGPRILLSINQSVYYCLTQFIIVAPRPDASLPYDSRYKLRLCCRLLSTLGWQMLPVQIPPDIVCRSSSFITLLRRTHCLLRALFVSVGPVL